MPHKSVAVVTPNNSKHWARLDPGDCDSAEIEPSRYTSACLMHFFLILSEYCPSVGMLKITAWEQHLTYKGENQPS